MSKVSAERPRAHSKPYLVVDGHGPTVGVTVVEMQDAGFLPSTARHPRLRCTRMAIRPGVPCQSKFPPGPQTNTEREREGEERQGERERERERDRDRERAREIERQRERERENDPVLAPLRMTFKSRPNSSCGPLLPGLAPFCFGGGLYKGLGGIRPSICTTDLP